MGCCIGDCCVIDCGFCCIFDSCSNHGCDYHPVEKNTVDHSKKIADELAEMKEKARKEGTIIGNEVFEYINVYMQQFIDHLKKINAGTYGGKRLNLKMDVIEKELATLRDEVKNFIGDRLDECLVTTDSELTVILEEHDEKKRKKNFDDFYVRIHKQAVMDLTKKIEEVIALQFGLVDAEIRNRLKEVDADMKNADAGYKEMERMLEAKDDALASKQVEYMYLISLSDLVIDELNSVAE